MISKGVEPEITVNVGDLAAATERVSGAAAAVRIEIAKKVFHIKRLPTIRAEIQTP
ncbi:MAG: hypothetical protein V3T62_04280 [Alphaproteobacteria bacterium]